MAKKENAQMSKEIVKRLKDINVNAKDEKDARKKLLKILTDNDIDGMEDETIETLLDIAESLVEDNAPEVTDEEAEAEALADEAEDEEEEEDADGEEPETEEETEEDDDEEEEDDEDDEEPEEEEPKPVKKSAKKEDSKPAKKAVKEEKKVVKEEKKEAKKATPKRGVKIDFRSDENEQKAFKKIWGKMFPESKYEYAWLVTNGCTIKHKGTNSNRGIVTVEACTRMEDKSIKCILYFTILNKKYEILEDAEIEYEKCWNGVPMVKGITMEQAVENVSTVLDEVVGIVEKLDKKLGDNRKKMEENLAKKSAEKATSKKVC